MPRRDVPTVVQLQARIDEALAIARASEEGVREVGEMALDATRQARRAAEAAEASAKAAVEAGLKEPELPRSQDEGAGPAGPVADLVPPPPATAGGRFPKSAPPTGRGVEGEGSSPPGGEEAGLTKSPRFEVRFRRFNERADRLSARLRALQDHPRHPVAPAAPARRR